MTRIQLVRVGDGWERQHTEGDDYENDGDDWDLQPGQGNHSVPEVSNLTNLQVSGFIPTTSELVNLVGDFESEMEMEIDLSEIEEINEENLKAFKIKLEQADQVYEDITQVEEEEEEEEKEGKEEETKQETKINILQNITLRSENTDDQEVKEIVKDIKNSVKNSLKRKVDEFMLKRKKENDDILDCILDMCGSGVKQLKTEGVVEKLKKEFPERQYEEIFKENGAQTTKMCEMYQNIIKNINKYKKGS